MKVTISDVRVHTREANKDGELALSTEGSQLRLDVVVGNDVIVAIRFGEAQAEVLQDALKTARRVLR